MSEVDELRKVLDLMRSAQQADMYRIVQAAERVGMTPTGCDTIDWMADEILALRAELAAVKFAAHMPADYEFGLASWINQHLYACYIGADISPEIQAQIESGRLTFPDAPAWKELAAARAALAIAHKQVSDADSQLVDKLVSDLAAVRQSRKRLVRFIQDRREKHRQVVEWFKLNCDDW